MPKSDDLTKRAESEEWLDNLRSEVEDIVDSIEEYLENRADEPLSVVGEFSFVADAVDDKESRNSESSDDSYVVNSAQKIVETLMFYLRRRNTRYKNSKLVAQH